jgi:hypothetical protein
MLDDDGHIIIPAINTEYDESYDDEFGWDDEDESPKNDRVITTTNITKGGMEILTSCDPSWPRNQNKDGRRYRRVWLPGQDHLTLHCQGR